MKEDLVSIVLSNYNGLEHLKECFETPKLINKITRDEFDWFVNISKT